MHSAKDGSSLHFLALGALSMALIWSGLSDMVSMIRF